MKRTSRTTVFVVQSYVARGRVWEAPAPTRIDNRSRALQFAAGIGPQCLGVEVFSVEVAEDVDYCGDPMLIATIGVVPVDE